MQSFDLKFARQVEPDLIIKGAFDHLEFREGPRSKTTRKHELSVDEIALIIATAKEGKLTQREVGAKFGVSAALVSRLVVAARKKSSFI